MRQLLVLVLFLTVAPLTLGVSLFALTNIGWQKKPLTDLQEMNFSNHSLETQLYAAVPQRNGEVLGAISSGDARPIIIERYLKKNKSPLLPYYQDIFQASETYGIDYRLIIAIAQCESNLCRKYPAGSYNCWGFENGDTHFFSWEQAINQVAKTLKEDYIDNGLTTPDQIMPKYAPPSVEKGGPWAKCVNQFMDELEHGNVD